MNKKIISTNSNTKIVLLAAFAAFLAAGISSADISKFNTGPQYKTTADYTVLGKVNRIAKKKVPKIKHTTLNKKEIDTEGWNREKDGRWYYIQNGKRIVSSWIKDNERWFRFNEHGILEENSLINVNEKWYYAQQGGYIAEHQWFSINGNWYYAEYGGYLACNLWRYIDGKWYHFNERCELSVNTTIGDYRVNENGERVE